MIMQKPVQQPGRQRGFTLIEVLIVFFVLSVGLLGMAALQMRSMQYNQGSYIRSQATMAAYDMLDRLRMNKAVALAGGYDVLYADVIVADGTIVKDDLAAWKAFLATTLPGGLGQVECETGQCTVEISWIDRLAPDPANPVVMSMTVQL